MPASQDIEASGTPAVKDLRSLFEQKAQAPSPSPSGSLRSGNGGGAFSPRQPSSRRASPTHPGDQSESPSPHLLKPTASEQGSQRKRPPPPPPPSRGSKPQLGSPSPSVSPLLHPTSELGYAPETQSPFSSLKQRLTARPPPPVPEFRLDQNNVAEPEAVLGGKDHGPSINSSAAPPPLPASPRRPAHAIRPSNNASPFESNLDTPPSIPPRRTTKPPPPHRAVRLSFPPDVDGGHSGPDSDAETISAKALALDPFSARRKPVPYNHHHNSQSSLDGSETTLSSASSSRAPSESDGNVPPPRIPPRPIPSKAPTLTEEPLTQSPVSQSSSGLTPPPLPVRRATTDPSLSHSPHPSRKASAQMPPPAHPHPSPPPPRIYSARPPPSRTAHAHTVHTPVHQHLAHPPAPPSHPHTVPPLVSIHDSGDSDEHNLGETLMPTALKTHANDAGAGAHKLVSAISKMPPPPTRTIALGERLPAVRPSISDDESEESAEEEDPKSKLANAMPDTSRSSRRPPVLKCHKYDSIQIQTQTHSAIVCAAGHVYVAVTGHHVKVYDLELSETPILSLDGKDVGLKELKATSLEFRPAKEATNKGRFVWIGTKDGHMFELDVTTGQITGTRLSAHLYAITRMLRYSDMVLSFDDNGKVTIWSPEVEGAELQLATAQVRGSRISDHQEFAEMLAGRLWTSARETTAPGARGPVVRIYDVLTPGSATRSVLPTEHVGTVTSGTVLPAYPGHVYLGHEGGFVSIWTAATGEGVPVCEEVMRISNSDVLCLAGVDDRLWVGGRNGTISTYSIESRPWVMTNNWVAHWNGQSVLPLQKIFVDPYSIEKLGRLCVNSIGRDDHIKSWDGLLGADRQDAELLKLEKTFSHFRDINILFVSWNIGASKPEQLSGTKENSSFLYDALNSTDSPPDIIVFGLQEVVPLDKANVAKFLKKKKGLEGASTTLHSEHRRWADKLVGAVTFALPNERYKLLYSKELVGLLSCVMVKTKEQTAIRDYAAHTVSRGVGGRFGNKGAVAIRLVIDDTSLCFLNCHLAAGHRRVRDRNADAAAIIEHERLFPESETLDEALAFVGGGDGTMALDHEIVFMSGDLNYRIDQRRDAVVTSVRQDTYHGMLVHDQLTKEMKANVRLRSFAEGAITFPPTYKYDLHSTEYDTSEKRRIPAWCDRVLWRARDPSRVEQLHYRRYEPDISDHRPISAAFRVRVKSIQHDARAGVKGDVLAQWAVREQQLLDNARAFYVEQLAL